MDFKLVLDRFENDRAVLISESGQEIVWPKKMLPPAAAEGQIFYVRLLDDPEELAKEKKKAHDLLNELLLAD